MMKKDIEKTSKQISDLYLQIEEELKQIDNTKINSITKYNEMTIIPARDNKAGFAEDAFLVTLEKEELDENGETIKEFSLYDTNNEKIGTINKDGKLELDEAYLENLENQLGDYAKELGLDDDKKLKVNEMSLEELKEINEENKDITYDRKRAMFINNKGEAIKEQEKQENNQKNNNSEEQENNKEEEKKKDRDKEEDKISKSLGMKAEDIRAYSTIKPQDRITDNQTFEDIAGIEGKYEKIAIVSTNGASKENTKFCFVGITKEGMAEPIQELESREGIDTGHQIYSINRDGSDVRKQQTTAMFNLKNDMNQGFSITLGQYGTVEASYIRRSKSENKYIGSPVETEHQRPTTTEVKEFMDKKRTTDTEMDEVAEKTEHSTEEVENGNTNINNIDNNPNNDKAIEPDESITMHNGEITTLAKEAERQECSLEEYISFYEKAEGDCPAEKIINANKAIKDQQMNDHEEEHELTLEPEDNTKKQ